MSLRSLLRPILGCVCVLLLCTSTVRVLPITRVVCILNILNTVQRIYLTSLTLLVRKLFSSLTKVRQIRWIIKQQNSRYICLQSRQKLNSFLVFSLLSIFGYFLGLFDPKTTIISCKSHYSIFLTFLHISNYSFSFSRHFFPKY